MRTVILAIRAAFITDLKLYIHDRVTLYRLDL